MQVTKTVRLTSGGASIDESIATTLARAAATTRGITSFEIVRVAGTVDEAGVPAEYQVTLDITFVVKDSPLGH
jgi:flavin-binding protein dodecin